MENKRFWLGMLVKLPLVVALVFGMTVVGCGEDSSGGGGGNPQTVSYQSADTAGYSYTLKITENKSRAVYVTKAGDTYALTISKAGETNKVSTGTVSAIAANGTLTLSPSVAGSPTFTVTITINGGITAITGPVTLDNEETVNIGELIPGEKPGEEEEPEEFTSLDAMEAWLQEKPMNTKETPYIIVLTGLNIETDFRGKDDHSHDFLGRLCSLKRYVSLDLSGCEGQRIPDMSYNDVSDRPRGYEVNGLVSIRLPAGLITIGNCAFLGCESLTSVTIPNSVTSIGGRAFYECISLTSVTIPDSVTSIGDSAFYFCESLTSVTIPDSVTSIGIGAFVLCSSLTVITVDSNNTRYCSEGGVLYNKDKSTLLLYPAAKVGSTFTIPNSVTNIQYDSFYECNNLTSVTIPNSVTSIGIDTPFWFCPNLTAITVDSGNTSFSSEGGVLYNKDKSTLLQYPPGKSGTFTIPNSVIRINRLSFYCSSGLTSVTIPNSVTSIGDSAFSLCYSLTSVSIPDSVTSIEGYAFSNCDSLTSVTFNGTIPSSGFSSSSSISAPFWGDLRTKFYATDATNGTPGTYTTTAPVSISSVWTRQ